MTLYLLNFKTLSHLARDPGGVVGRRIRQVGNAAVCTSVVVAGEMRFGAIRKGHDKLHNAVEAVLSTITIEPLIVPVGQHDAQIRADLERCGPPIGANDLWIAVHALALDCTLVTANVGEFSRVEGLRWENWLDISAPAL